MLTPEQENLRRSRGELMAELVRAGARFKTGSNACTCPFHDDRRPSAGVYREGEVWRFKCHGCDWGGDVFDVRARLAGTAPGDELKAERREVAHEPPPRWFASVSAMAEALRGVVATYVYANPETRAPELVVFRCEEGGRKRFIQARPEGSGFVMKAPAGKLPLYNRARIAGQSAVVVVEGEKCVHALHDIGVAATTSPGGAMKAAHADWTPLRGKTCYLWADNDEPDATYPEGKGRAHMREVARILESLECDVRAVDVSALNLPPKGDAVDFLERNGGTREDKQIAVALVTQDAEASRPSKGLDERIEQMISGAWQTLDWPWPKVTSLSRALMPGTVTALPGEGGSSKSFFALEANLYWHLNGRKTALYELEEDRTYHLQRALAQLENNSNLTDDVWVRANPEEARAAYRRQKDILDSFGRTMWDAPDEMVDLPSLVAWLEARCAEGCEVVTIDPVTAAKVSKEPWLDDQRFILGAKAVVRKYGARLILVTHPRKNRGQGKATGLNDMAGGSAYERFTQTVLWMKRHDTSEKGDVLHQGFPVPVTYDRTLRVAKARNGPGTGTEIAYCFEPESLRFSEQGVIVKASRRKVETPEAEERW